MPTQTSIYNQPVLNFAAISGLNVNGNTGAFSIPLVLTNITGASRKPKTNPVGVMPIMYGTTSFGGQTLAQGPSEAAKMLLEGFIDTPTITVVGTMTGQLPNIVATGGVYLTYAEVIAMCFEGRANPVNGFWSKTDPIYFRDPYGRQYNSPGIIDFTSSYVEAVPGRTNFTMTLLI